MSEQNADTEQELPALPKKRRDGVITAVLTADNHLGFSSFGLPPRKREERRRLLCEAFQRATDFAIVQGVDLFLQAGDLFESVAPEERERSFVAERLAQLRQAGVKSFAVGGVHDSYTYIQSQQDQTPSTPQMSYARLGALHYFSPQSTSAPLEPVVLEIDGIRVGICAANVLAGQEGDPLAALEVQDDIERAAISLLLLHAPIEGFASPHQIHETQALVSRQSLSKQDAFRYILAGYHHRHHRFQVGKTEVLIAGSTQRLDSQEHDVVPGFLFLGLAADGLRWCNHIPIDTQPYQKLVLEVGDLWSANKQESPTEGILARLRPLCTPETIVQIRLEGSLTRSQYHQLDLNQIRRYGEEHCFSLSFDDSALSLQSDSPSGTSDAAVWLSSREELTALVDEWVAQSQDEQEQKALCYAKEELFLALDNLYDAKGVSGR